MRSTQTRKKGCDSSYIGAGDPDCGVKPFDILSVVRFLLRIRMGVIFRSSVLSGWSRRKLQRDTYRKLEMDLNFNIDVGSIHGKKIGEGCLLCGQYLILPISL
jgi:hypothetical protein